MAVQTTNTIEFENLDELMQKIKELQSSNPRMKKQLNAMMREVIRQAVKDVKAAAKSELPNDPRKAFNAVRSSVYKRILGGQVNILARKKNNGKMYVGGNHSSSRPSSQRTKDLQGYYGSDRGFILRFLNAGTEDRTAKTMNAHGIKATSHYTPKGVQKNRSYNPARQYKGSIGFRGSIGAKNWFNPASSRALENAASQFSELFDRAIVELWNE